MLSGVEYSALSQDCGEFRLVGQAHCKDTLPLKGGGGAEEKPLFEGVGNVLQCILLKSRSPCT